MPNPLGSSGDLLSYCCFGRMYVLERSIVFDMLFFRNPNPLGSNFFTAIGEGECGVIFLNYGIYTLSGRLRGI